MNPDRIRILDPLVTRKIAAGEIIERPNGVVRELLDNSLDAHANQISIEVAEGGISLIRVVDDGDGMSATDLERCVLPHATSKITTDEDLLRIRTLGFRGEALSSIAAVSRLEIVSGVADATPHRIRVEAGRVVAKEPAGAPAGTTVEVADLFYNVPARKLFQKRAGSEYSIIRGVVLDKAIAFPEVSFRLATDREPRLTLVPQGQVERIAAAYPERTEPALLHDIGATGDGFRATIVAGEPAAHRKDRRHLQVFVNRRRVWEYALVQAMEYAYRDYLHGGLYPTAYLFLEIEPELVDFNIHPTKREVRFRNLPDIHRRIVAALGEFLRVFDRRAIAIGEELPFSSAHGQSETRERAPTYRPAPPHRSSASAAFDLNVRLAPGTAPPVSAPSETAHPAGHPAGHPAERPADGDATTVPQEGFRYLGQIMDLFLVVERGNVLYLVDQHAAHERIIYDRLRNGASGQELLFPVRIEVDSDANATLESQTSTLRRLGIELERVDSGWELTTVPNGVSIEPETLASLLMELIDRPADFERELYASLSCRSAVMDGDRLAPETAIEIVRGVIGMENAVCPHGRPVWVAWSRDELAGFVGRT